ncbi:MAG: ABC transporter permease subunit [Streptosporangiales bacterium]|nr:ABC transporter permease subunit [Streptosporangiales bacterium]
MAATQLPVIVRRRARSVDAGFGTGLLVTGVVLLGIVAVAALAAPLLTSWGPMQIDPNATLRPPGGTHLLGTDSNGMDVWSRLLHSVAVDLGVAVTAVALAVVLGSTVGLVCGFRGGWLDDTAMRVVDMLQAFPTFILALAVAALLGPGIGNLIVVLAVVNAPAYARLVRAEVRTVRELPYVDAARLSGSRVVGMLWRHVLPNSVMPVRVLAPLNCGWAMLALAGLSFVGLGVPIPQPEWGAMISIGSSDIVAGRWWTSVPPGLALLVCVLAFSMIGEGLQERSMRRST